MDIKLTKAQHDYLVRLLSYRHAYSLLKSSKNWDRERKIILKILEKLTDITFDEISIN